MDFVRLENLIKLSSRSINRIFSRSSVDPELQKKKTISPVTLNSQNAIVFSFSNRPFLPQSLKELSDGVVLNATFFLTWEGTPEEEEGDEKDKMEETENY